MSGIVLCHNDKYTPIPAGSNPVFYSAPANSTRHQAWCRVGAGRIPFGPTMLPHNARKLARAAAVAFASGAGGVLGDGPAPLHPQVGATVKCAGFHGVIHTIRGEGVDMEAGVTWGKCSCQSLGEPIPWVPMDRFGGVVEVVMPPEEEVTP